MDSSPPGPGRVGRRYVISGRVQGVGFRYFVLRRAQELDLVGWTRNLENGDVEVRAWGGEAALAAFRDEVARGPRSAKVTNVDITEISDAENSGSVFRIIG